MATNVTVDDKFFEFNNHLRITSDVTYEEWSAYGKKLSKRYSTLQWLIGDWINWGEQKWGEKYAQALDDLSFSYGTLRNYASICARISPENRNPKLRFHQIKHVASLEPREQRKIVDFATSHEMTGDDILEAVQRITGKRKMITSYEGTIARTYSQDDGYYLVIKTDSDLKTGQHVTIKIKD